MARGLKRRAVGWGACRAPLSPGQPVLTSGVVDQVSMQASSGLKRVVVTGDTPSSSLSPTLRSLGIRPLAGASVRCSAVAASCSAPRGPSPQRAG